MKTKKNIKYTLIVIIALVTAIYNFLNPPNENYPLSIRYIDVSQGDSSLILLPNGETMLIDAGENKYSNNVVRELNKLNIHKIDHLIATHPHSDHIGGMERIINNYQIGNIYMPKTEHTSKTYLDMLESISDNKLQITTARAGLTIIDDGELKAEFVAPSEDYYEEINNYSAVLKLTYKENTFLFCGDIEALVEKEILSNGYDIASDVLKVSHHGSYRSTSDVFLNAVNPQYAVISCGKDNEYGHPHREILQKLKSITVLRTDKTGTITLYSDGKKITEAE